MFCVNLYILWCLINCLLFIRLISYANDKYIEDFTGTEWWFIILFSVFAPAGLILMIVLAIGWILFDWLEIDEWNVWYFFTKQRKWGWKQTK